MVWGFIFWALASGSPGASKLSTLQKMRSESTTGIIDLGAEDYKLYLRHPRPYTLFVMLTGPVQQFPQLAPFETAFAKLSESYSSATEEHQKRTQDVFFITVDAHSNREISALHEINGIPVIAHIDRLAWKGKDVYRISKRNILPPQRDMRVEVMLAWANGFTNVNVQRHLNAQEKIANLSIFLFVGVLVIGTIGAVIVAIRRHRTVMVIGAFIIYSIAISGFFSNLLDRGGIEWGPSNRAFFMPGTRSQYLREGVLVAITTLIPPISIIAVINAHKFGWDEEDRHFFQLLCIGLALILSAILIYFFKVKSRWYGEPPFFPYSNMKTGSIYVDQGNTIL